MRKICWGRSLPERCARPRCMRSGRRRKHHMASALPHVRRSLRRSLASLQTGPDCHRAAETPRRGATVYADKCAACHGKQLEGNPAKGIGGDKLLGGRGTLASKTPIKTVESYWPYATTLFDYVKRSMPFNAPGSLSDEEVYSVVAYILSEAKIITPVEKMDATTLPKVVMPNRDGFEPDPRPEVQLYR